MARSVAERRLVRLYRSMVRDLNALLMQAQEGTASAAFIQNQLRVLTRQLAALGQAEAAWVSETIPAEYRDSAGQAQLTLRRGDVPVLTSSFTGVDRRTVEALSSRVSDDLASVRNALGVGLALGSSQRLGAQAVEEVLRGDSRFITFRAGEARVRVPSGRMWRPDAYATMLSRTAVADSRRVAFRQRYLQNGVDRVVVVANGTTHDVCAAWEGVSLSLTGATEGLPTVADAAAAGLFHPNCAHRYVVDRRAEAEPAALPAELPPEDRALPILGRAAPRRSRRVPSTQARQSRRPAARR